MSTSWAERRFSWQDDKARCLLGTEATATWWRPRGQIKEVELYPIVTWSPAFCQMHHFGENCRVREGWKTDFFLVLFFLWLHWVFVAARGLSLVVASRGYSLLWCTGLWLRWPLLLQSTGSRHAGFSSCGTRAPELRLSSCGAWAQLLRGMWDLPGPGIEPMSLALAGGFLTTAPPGKPYICVSVELQSRSPS